MTIVAMCMFGLMASVAQADEMASEGGMMDDDMEESMEHPDMTKDDMSDAMDQGMKDDDMSGDGMGMKDDKAMHDDMKDDGMDKSDSMN
ncbi:MAG: hypothetical protein R3295_11135 [Marinobacter sp.]|nr:hypothetical protein [Marinobacter sp.]